MRVIDDLAATIARTTVLVAQSRRTIAALNVVLRESQEARARSRQLFSSMEHEAPPEMAAAREQRSRRKRSKLFYKHRWLVSANMIVALRRAGVVCDIVLPDHAVVQGLDAPPSLQPN